MASRVGMAACCLLMLLVLSTQQQQVEGLSKFCRCYRNCYTDCRKTEGRYPCNANCFQDCIDAMLPLAAPTTVPVDCRDICLMGFCGSMEITDHAMAGDAEACVADCTKKLVPLHQVQPRRSTDACMHLSVAWELRVTDTVPSV